MPKKQSVIFVTLGSLLLLLALLIVAHNEIDSHKAGQSSAKLLDGIQTAIEKEKDKIKSNITNPSGTIAEDEVIETLDTTTPTISIEGYEYIGYISIPQLELKLPVMSDWDYSSLKLAPGCQFGSSKTDDLVIMAHNYKTHFGYLHTLKIGDEISFTDMDGIENRYALSKMDTLPADAVDAVQNSGHDLVLYTCTPSGTNRLVAFCDRVQAESND